MINKKLHFFFIFISCINLTQSVRAMETDPLLINAKKVAAPPIINVARPQCTKDGKLLTIVYGLLGLTAEVGGGFLLGWVGPTKAIIPISVVLMLLGVGLHGYGGYLLWHKYRTEPAVHHQFVEQINKQLEYTHNTCMSKYTLSAEFIEYRVIRQDKVGLKYIITNITQVEFEYVMRKELIARQHNRLKTLLLCFKRKQLPRDIQFKIIAHYPELATTDQEVFNRALPHAYCEGHIPIWLQLFPFQWFCNYYRLRCSNEHKVEFSRTVAQAATEVRMDKLLSFLPQETRELFTPGDHRKMQETLFKRYKAKLTTAALPEV